MLRRHQIYHLVAVCICLLIQHFISPYALCQSYSIVQKSGLAEYKIDYIAQLIVVKAKGASDERQKSIAEKKMWAIVEARKNCITQAAAAIGEVLIEGETILETGEMRGHNIKLSINEYVRGIKGLKEEYETMDDGSILAEVRMSIRFDGNKGLNKFLFDTFFDDDKKPFPKPYNRVSIKKYPTGIVLDTRNSDIKLYPSLTPRIYDDSGRLIYGPDQVSRITAAKSGISTFTRNYKSQKKRLGNNPLIIEVKGVIEKYPSSVLISRKDADFILQLEQDKKILSNCKVVFLIRY